jgi:quinol monooxygenase YgiN
MTEPGKIDPEPMMVRIAELVIADDYLAAYRTLLAEEIDASLASEPGVLSLQAVFLQDAPNQVRLLEVYADEAAYLSHLQSPHFLKYKSATAHMVRDLRLLPATPIRLQVDRPKP